MVASHPEAAPWTEPATGLGYPSSHPGKDMGPQAGNGPETIGWGTPALHIPLELTNKVKTLPSRNLR